MELYQLILRMLVILTVIVCVIAYVLYQAGHHSSKVVVLHVSPRNQSPNFALSHVIETSYHAEHVRKGCSSSDKAAKYYSQFSEDFALFHNYFNSPAICDGVYVEIGALDGVQLSNTKFFEDYLNWTGVLIEAQPDNAKKLLKNRKKSHNVIIAEAVCPKGQRFVNFSAMTDASFDAVGGIPDEMTNFHIKRFFKDRKPETVAVPCRPIGRMLREAGIKAIDFFILDVEGAELMVLETMDWTIPVKVFVVEMGRGEVKDHALIHLMFSNGYRKPNWDIRGYCQRFQFPCTGNQIFEHQNYTY